MVKKVIKVPFVEEVTGKSGASVMFVEGSTIPLDTTVQAAIDGLFVIGQAQLVKNNFLGLMKSMADGIQRDGKPRKIADFLRVFPVFTGEVDLDRGYDPKKNGVYIAAALLNEMKLDISGWSFEDVTKGRQPITLESATGSEIGVVDSNAGVELNGRGLSGDHRVELQLEDGEIVRVAPEHVSGNISRMDLAAEAFAPYRGEEFYGKKLKITVRGNFANDSITVTLEKPVTPPAPRLTKIVNKDGVANAWHPFGDEVDVTAENAKGEDAKVTVELLEKSTGNVKAILPYTDGNTLERVDAKTFRLHFRANPTDCPDSMWTDTTRYATVIRVKTDNGEAVSEPLAIV